MNHSAPEFAAAGKLLVLNGRWPVLDESDSPLGFYIKLRNIPVTDYLLRVDTVVAPDYGVTATLEVELDRAAYINGFHLGPFVNYPVRLKSITAEGLSESTGRVIYDGDIVLDRDLSVRFDRQLMRQMKSAISCTINKG